MSQSSFNIPTRRQAVDFWWRSHLLMAWHAVHKLWRSPIRRLAPGGDLADAPILAEIRSPLWNTADPAEFILDAGKVENLRVARRAFDGVEIPAGETFSFWRQLGRPSRRRGFVIGREVRQGCIVPTVAGGLCQLSNAIITAAYRAEINIVEHHTHTARNEPGDLDATVFWNYVDLKLKASFPWRLSVALTPRELVVSVRGRRPGAQNLPITLAPATLRQVRNCLSCGETGCFRQRAQPPSPAARTAALLDNYTPEFETYLAAHYPKADRFQPTPARLAFWRDAASSWTTGAAYRAVWVSWRRAFAIRLAAYRGNGQRQAGLIAGRAKLARAYASRLRPEHVRLIVDQGLLPHLHRLGALAGREVTVFAHAAPMADIEACLDRAARAWPNEPSLRDFRAPASLIAAEAEALANTRIVTPHAEVAALLSADLVEWAKQPIEATSAVADGPPLILFPASVLPRKGARELAAALRGLEHECRLLILGAPASQAGFWGDIAVTYVDRHSDWPRQAQLVVLPAWVEHLPRQLLRALGAGIPVIATPACGLPPQSGVTLVEAGNVSELRMAIQSHLARIATKRERC